MTESFKARMSQGVFHSKDHIAEFGDCIGIVEDLVQWSTETVGPEVNVRWQPSNLRYCYDPETDLETVSDDE